MSNAPLVPELPLPEGAEWIYQARGADLSKHLARCDAWLWTSREEGFGLPLLEASACRTPVIATPAGAAPEIMARGGGILVPPENPDAIAEAIVKICSLPEADWKALSEKALAAVTGFTWDDASRQFAGALETIKHRSAD
jgi:glycosyltransferase involved in cell wall biosynthesis